MNRTISEPALRERELECQEHTIQKLSHYFELQRRDFFKLLGCGVVVGLAAKRGLAQESGHARGGGEQENLPDELSAWIHISETGTVTAFTGKVEIGQNARTSLSQQVAEELHAPLASVALVMGDTQLTPFDMGTFGSRTTPTMGPRLRMVAAQARELLIQMAAQHWNLSPASLTAANGQVTDPSGGRSISYGELTHGQQLVKVIGDPPLEEPKDWQIAGTSAPKVDGRAFVTGEHKYPADQVRPGWVCGKVVRPSAFKATLKSLDISAAAKLPGVTIVHDGDFVGVTASDVATAERAVKAVRAEWTAPEQPSNADLFEYLRKHPSQETGFRGNSHSEKGFISQGLAEADKKLSQTYTVAYIAHVPLEPRSALAEWQGGKLTVWTGTQRPFAVRDELAQAFRLPSDDVRVLVPDIGAAYGGKHTGECAVEAARLAKAAGKPVKLIWTREEEFTWAYFRPAGAIDITSGASKNGKITAWQYDNYNSGPAAISTPYEIANQQIEFHATDSPLRQGSYRGLAATANHFAREVHMDELAYAIGMEPLEFRLKNLTNERLRAVFQNTAETFGWGKERSSSTRGFGLGGGTEKGSNTACCAEVEIRNGQVHIRRVVVGFECGAIVNPGGLQNQVEGATVQAIGGALFESIRFADGRILNPHLAQYRVPRFRDVPEIRVVLLDRKDIPPAGAGETPIVGLAPAVGNAIFAATGVRLRSLPMVPNGLESKG